MSNALIYCRVSTEEQADNGYSLDAQEKLCKEFAKSNDYDVIKVFRDEGKSATNLNRPALKDLLSLCQQNNSIDALIIQETDRLARNTKDHLTVKALLKRENVKIISVAQPMLDDSPEGKMVDTIIASINQFQSDINSRKTMKGLIEKFEQGWWPGFAPLGYKNVEVKDENGNTKKIIKKDPNKWGLVEEGFRLYLTGSYSVRNILDELHQKGLRARNGKKVSQSTFFETIRNPFYAGLMRWSGMEGMGKHDQMITLKEHREILSIIDCHNMNACRVRKHSFLLRGFAYCNICKLRYTAGKNIKKKKDYYHCSTRENHSNQGQNIETWDLEEQIANKFKEIQFSKDVILNIVARLKKFHQELKEVTALKKENLLNEKKTIEEKRSIIEEKLLNGIIADKDYVRISGNFSKLLNEVQTRIYKLEDHCEFEFDIIREVLKLSQNIFYAYQKAPYELKRLYLGLFWDKFLVQNKKIVQAIPTKFIQSLTETMQVLIRVNWGGQRELNPY